MDYSVFAQRLTETRKKAGLSQSRLAELVGLSRQTFVRWEGGDTSPDIDDVKEVAIALNTSVAYLIGETNDPAPANVYFNEKIEPTDNLRLKITRDDKEYTEAELAEKPVSRVANGLKSNIKYCGQFLEIPLLTIANTASCGAGNGLYGVISESTENIFVERQAFNYIDNTRKPFAVPIEGDSMIGAGLEEGANAVINPADEVLSGDTALVCLDGNWLIKWIVYNPDGSVDLKPANPNYKTTHIETAYTSDPSWFRIIGKVVRIVNTSRPKRAF